MVRSTDPLSVLSDLTSSEAKARLKALKALRKAEGSEVEVQPLVDLVFRETNAAVMAEAVLALQERVLAGCAPSDGIGAALAHALESDALSGAKDGRIHCVRGLELYPDHPIALKSLIDALGDSDRDVRLAAAIGLSLFQDPTAAEAVSIGLRSGTIPSASGRPRNPCLVAARTIDLFVGEDAVVDAFRERLAAEATITLTLRVPWIRTMPRLGGIVCTDGRMLVAFRNPNLAGITPRHVNYFRDWRFDDITSFSPEKYGRFSLRCGDDYVLFGNVGDPPWAPAQWSRHYPWLASVIG